MSKKIFGGKKKKKAEDPVVSETNLPKAVITALTPEETRRRKLLPRQAPLNIGSILGTSSTLGG